jgi:hypothetical protein
VKKINLKTKFVITFKMENIKHKYIIIISKTTFKFSIILYIRFDFRYYFIFLSKRKYKQKMSKI